MSYWFDHCTDIIVTAMSITENERDNFLVRGWGLLQLHPADDCSDGGTDRAVGVKLLILRDSSTCCLGELRIETSDLLTPKPVLLPTPNHQHSASGV